MRTRDGAGTARVGAWDAAVSAWAVLCLGLAVYTGVEISRLTDIGDTLVVSSRALDSTAAAVERLKNVPFVGSNLGDLAAQIGRTADSARRSGASSRATIGRVALLLAIAIFVIAVVPPVVAWLAVRRRLLAPRGTVP
jgi:hypothetical protein